MKSIKFIISLLVCFGLVLSISSCDEVQNNQKNGSVTFGANYHVINCITTVTIFLDGENIGTLQHFVDAIDNCGETENITKNIPIGIHSYKVEIRPESGSACTKDILGTFEISENECKIIFIDYFQIDFPEEESDDEEEEPNNDNDDGDGGSGGDDGELCSCLNMENVKKTIPIINDFLAELPDGTSPEQTFESLKTWLNSFPCNINAKILYGGDMTGSGTRILGVAISVKDNEIVRELELDFAATNYSQIAGYKYTKQDAIHVKTNYTKISNVFDFINSLELDVKQIESGTYLSSMAANTDTLQYIINNLKAKPYTSDSWVTGHLNWYNANIVIFVNLYDMKNKVYQEDWIKTMNEYKFENYKDAPGHIIVFYIPEGTGKQWETKFTEYDFINWAEQSYTRYTIR